MSKDATENKLWPDAGPQLRRDLFQHSGRLHCGDYEPRTTVSPFQHKRTFKNPHGFRLVVYTNKPDTELQLEESFQLVPDQEPIEALTINVANGAISGVAQMYGALGSRYNLNNDTIYHYDAQAQQVRIVDQQAEYRRSYEQYMQQMHSMERAYNNMRISYTDNEVVNPGIVYRDDRDYDNQRAAAAQQRTSHTARQEQSRQARRSVWDRMIGR